MLTSGICTEKSLRSPGFVRWSDELYQHFRMHRKIWEFAFIAQALEERGCIQPGKRGLGFAVGVEPLTALFAKYGCHVVASDLGVDVNNMSDWAATNQHAQSLEQLNLLGVCPPDVFAENVRFEFVDMNAIPDHLNDFDFCWSAGSVEHVGGMELSKKAIVSMTECCKPGGVSVHTTELNLLSNDKTLDTGWTVFYRHKDFFDVATMLHRAGHRLLPIDGDVGDGEMDHYIDEPPFSNDDHLKLYNVGHTISSIGLVIEVGAVPEAERESDRTEPVWFNDDFFTPAGAELRKNFGKAGEPRLLKKRIHRLTELVTELRGLIGSDEIRPAYRSGDAAPFRRACRAGARAVALDGNVVLAQVFGDTHYFLRTADPDVATLAHDGCAELSACVTLVRRTSPGQTVMHLGAGTGYLTLLAARLVGSEGRVIAAESHDGSLDLLERSCRANHLSWVETHAARASDELGEHDRSVEELVRGRALDLVIVSDPGQLESAWSGLAGARDRSPGLLFLLTVDPTAMVDAAAWMACADADGYNFSLLSPAGEVLPVPPVEGFAPGDPAWTLFGAAR